MGAKKICRYDREQVRKHLDKYHLPGTGDEGTESSSTIVS